MKLRITVLVLVLSAGAGCTGFLSGGQDSGGQEYVEARVVEDVPDDAPVTSHDDERIRDVEPIQEAVEKAVSGDDDSVRVAVTPEQAQEARDALESVPSYDGDPGGFYVRKDNQTVVINFLKEQ